MGERDDSSDGEYRTAVAAAVFAITSLEEESSLKQKSSEGLKRSLTKTKSKKEESTDKATDYTKISRWFSGKDAKEDGRSAGDSSMRKSTTLDERLREESTVDRKVPPKAMGTTPTVKKTATSFDKYPKDAGNKSSKQEQGPRTGQQAPPAIKPTALSPGSRKWDANTINSGREETKADAWEKAKMAKIKKKYENLIITILEWENEKKTKAKRRMERKEREIEERRARVLQEHRNEMARIDNIANGARALAEERKRKDENKTIEKAKVLRSTGKLPNECCSCF